MRRDYVVLSPSQIASGEIGQQDIDYRLDRAPFTRYYWNGTEFVEVGSSGGGTGVILSTAALTASALIKTGPAKAYSLVITSGSGYVTLRDGTNIGGALVTGWGSGTTSGINTGDEATVNVPYAPSTAPTDFASGLYAEVSGTVTFVVFYQ